MKTPVLGENVQVAEGVVLKGDVTLEKNANIWYNAVLRGDSAPIVIGEGSNIQDCCVVHVNAKWPVNVGKNVTVGHGAILHGCTVGDNTTVGMGAILLNGCRVGRNCIIGAGALVSQGKEIPDGMLAFGNPAKVIRPLTEAEIAFNTKSAENYVREAAELIGGKEE